MKVHRRKFKLQFISVCSVFSVAKKKKMKRGFTLIELVVAVGLLAMMLVFAGGIFKASIGAQRTAGANGEVMQKFRAITDQLNTDFRGLRKDAPLLIRFQRDPNTGERFDQIMFFADGDFQSTQTYDFGRTPAVPSFAPIGPQRPLASNVARVYYGQALVYSTTARLFMYPWRQTGINEHDRMLNTRARTLARRQHLLTAEPDVSPFPSSDPAKFQQFFSPQPNNDFEHDAISLSQWRAFMLTPVNCNKVLDTCFNNDYRPPINLSGGTGLYMLMAQGVSSFSIQWAYYSPVFKKYLWYPSADPDGDGNISDSDFTAMAADDFGFGVYFNIAVPTLADWFSPDKAHGTYFTGLPDLPRALKFTFTLYDSKGILKRPQTFTHIVYLDD